ncbi:MAG: hypothetical protein WA081_22675 [Desulfosalsimonadaceae bacterium]
MMQQESRRRENGGYIFGEKSKLANWVLNHPIHIGGCCVLIGTPLLASDKLTLIDSFVVNLLFFFGLSFFLRFICRNLCYWVKVDVASGKIIFYRCFNKGVVEASLNLVEFVFDTHFACHYDGERFTIFNEYMNDIVEVLPHGMEIRFSNSFYGRFMKKQFERNRRRARKV